jgi:hypothetical protein
MQGLGMEATVLSAEKERLKYNKRICRMWFFRVPPK